MPIVLNLTTPDGVSLGQPATIGELTLSRYTQDIGMLHCRLGIDWEPYLDYEVRVEAWRMLPFVAPIQIRTYFVENITVVTDETKRSEVAIDAYDANVLLKWRDIEAAAGSAEANKTDHADDVMKAYVREELGPSGRNPLDAGHFSVDADEHLGASITVSNAWSAMMQALNGISDLAAAKDTRVLYEVAEGSEPCTYHFRTALGYLGTDRSAGTANRLLVGLDYGNVRGVTHVRDASEEVNHVVSAGSGRQEERLTATAVGAGATRNIWSRKKLVYNDSVYDTQAALDDQASKRLTEGRPRERLEFDLMESPGFRFGYDFGFGDKLTITHQGVDYDALVKGVVFWVYENGAERLQSVAEVDL